METLLDAMSNLDNPKDIDFDTYIDLSKAQDYAIQMQHLNIKRVEDFEILEKMEHDKGPSDRILQETEAIQNRIFG